MTEKERMESEEVEEESTETEEGTEDEDVTESDEGTDDSGDEDLDAIKAEMERLKRENNKLNNKLKYKKFSKPKKEDKGDVDYETLLDKKFEERDFKSEHPDVDLEEHKAFAEEKGLSLEDAFILKEGYKMKDEGYVNQQEAGKQGLHGTFKQKKVEKVNPFAKWPAISIPPKE